MDWFEKLTSFREESSQQVRNLIADDGKVKSLVNGRTLRLERDIDLDVAIVSYGSSKPFVQKLVESFS